jgi:hypothetical protein
MRRARIAALLTLAATGAHATGVFFDDFSHADHAALAAAGWTVRSGHGHPGVPGAAWRADAVRLLDDATRGAGRHAARNRLLRLIARTDGTAPGTVQSQVCHARKVLHGTYAARVRFTDAPVQGGDGDPVVQSFYAVAPLRHDFDPEFSEIDWEYLPNGGWGSDSTRLYGISWQTVRVEPWQAHNQAHQEFGSHAGWRVLVMQVADGRTRHFLDGRLLATHGGRNVPVVPMAISFNLWFSPGGLLPASAVPRVWRQQVDWVFHARHTLLSPAQVEAEVQALRRAGVARHDTVPAAKPPLASPCNF